MMLTEKTVLIEITKNVFWEDYGTNRLVFKKGWIGEVTGYYQDGELNSVSGESPIHEGVSDTIWEGHYIVLEVLSEKYDVEV